MRDKGCFIRATCVVARRWLRRSVPLRDKNAGLPPRYRQRSERHAAGRRAREPCRINVKSRRCLAAVRRARYDGRIARVPGPRIETRHGRVTKEGFYEPSFFVAKRLSRKAQRLAAAQPSA